MFSLIATSSDSNKILISIPSITTESETPEINSQILPSWCSAICLLTGKNQKNLSDWEKQALLIQNHLATTNLIKEKVSTLFKFLTIEAEKEENKELEFARGQINLFFSGVVQMQNLAIENALRTNDQSKIELVYQTSLKTAKTFYLTKFSLNKTDWTPHKDPISLKETLLKHGPMLVFGNFGRKFYAGDPFPLEEKFLNHTLWGWKKGEKRLSGNQIEAVILIGAWIEKSSSRVYFVDPQETEIPLKDRNIYVISYNNLLANIANDDEQLFSTIKPDDDFYCIPCLTPLGFQLGVPMYKVLENPHTRYPGIDYKKTCKSNYGFHCKNIALKPS